MAITTQISVVVPEFYAEPQDVDAATEALIESLYDRLAICLVCFYTSCYPETVGHLWRKHGIDNPQGKVMIYR